MAFLDKVLIGMMFVLLIFILNWDYADINSFCGDFEMEDVTVVCDE